MMADLHIHTIASDGVNSPAEVVQQARMLGLGAIAITDHDTLEGNLPAIKAGKVHGIDVLPGVELGSEYKNREIHILGYMLDINNEELIDKLYLLRISRMKRMEKMLARLCELGILIDPEIVLDICGSSAIGRPHLAAAMVKAGVVDSISEAFNKYIGAGRTAYIPRDKFNPVDTIRLIRASGGVPVLAHPGLGNTEQFMEEFIMEGLAGIEVYHPLHSLEQKEYYKELAETNGLIITGGSDYHGPEHKAGLRLGLEAVPYDAVIEIRKKMTVKY